MMNSVPTPVLVGNATFRVDGAVRTFEECVGKFQKIAGVAAHARGEAIARDVACGAFLVECQAQMNRLVWGRFIQRIGINQKTARRQVVMALKFAATDAARMGGVRGEVDWAKFEAAVRAWNAEHPEGHPLHVKAGPVGLRMAQFVAGARVEERNARTENEYSRTHGSANAQPVRDGQARGVVMVNSLPLGVGVHNAPASFPGTAGSQQPSVAGSPLSTPVPAVNSRGAGFDTRRSGQLSLADEYEAVQAERLRLEAMLAEIVGLVQMSGGGGVDVRGALARIGGDVEGLLRVVRGEG